MRNKILFSLVSAFVLGLGLAACDDDSQSVCDEAADIISNCDIEGLEDSGTAGSACEAQTEAIAQCVVDNPADTCAALEAAASFEAPSEDNGYLICSLEVTGL